MKGNKALWLTIGVIVIAIIAILLVQQNLRTTGREEYRIGMILPLTGTAGILGNSVMSGMKLAVEDFNAKYGTNYSIDFQDTQGDPKRAVDIYQRNKALYPAPVVLSWMSNNASALIELTESDNTVLFMGAAKSALTEGKRFAVRVFPNASDLAQMAVRFMGELGVGSVGIYYINDDYGRDVGEKAARLAEQNGLRVVFVEPVEAKASNMRDYVAKHARAKVDLLYLVVYGTVYPPLLQEVKQYFPSSKIFADITFCNYNTQQQIGALGEGVFTVGTEADDRATEWKPARDFQTKIKQKFGLDADFNSALGYDMAWIALEALHHSEAKTAEQVIRYIAQKAEFDGVSGLIRFKPTGDATFSLKLLVRQNGVLRKVSEGGK